MMCDSNMDSDTMLWILKEYRMKSLKLAQWCTFYNPFINKINNHLLITYSVHHPKLEDLGMMINDCSLKELTRIENVYTNNYITGQHMINTARRREQMVLLSNEIVMTSRHVAVRDGCKERMAFDLCFGQTEVRTVSSKRT